MKKIVLNEKLEKKFLEYMICESEKYPVHPENVIIVKKFLDKNFKKGFMTDNDINGLPKETKTIGLKDSTGNIIKNFTIEQLFDLLENEFVNLYSDKIQRGKFLAQVIRDWYNDKISKDGLLSVNSY